MDQRIKALSMPLSRKLYDAQPQATTETTKPPAIDNAPPALLQQLAAINGGKVPTPEEFERLYEAFTYRPTCQQCSDAGYTRLDVPFGHPNFGKYLPCPCQEAVRQERRWRRMQKVSDLSEQMRDMTFATFKRQREPAAYEAALAYADDPDGLDGAPPWLLFQGLPGNGKTHLLAAIAQALFARALPRYPLYVMAPRMFDFLRQGFDNGDGAGSMHDRLDALMQADVLLIDDLAAEQETPWQKEKLFSLLNHRYANQLPTVIATNVAPEHLDARISSRLQDRKICEHHQLESQDYRLTNARAKESAPRRRRVAS